MGYSFKVSFSDSMFRMDFASGEGEVIPASAQAAQLDTNHSSSFQMP
jgi:hypothetical protein